VIVVKVTKSAEADRLTRCIQRTGPYRRVTNYAP
jgi:hypothetical protein